MNISAYTNLLNRSDQLTATTYTLSDSYLNYERILVIIKHHASGVIAPWTFFPRITDGFGVFSVYNGSDITEAYGSFTNGNQISIAGTTSKYPYWMGVWGVNKIL